MHHVHFYQKKKLDPRVESRTDIAVFLPSLAGGGAERVILYLCKKFCERGLLVDLIIVDDSGPLNYLIPQETRLVNFKKRKPIKSIIKLIKYLKKNKPKSIISVLTHANIACAIAHIISNSSCNLVLSERINIVTDLSSRALSLDVLLTTIAIKFLYKHAYKIIAVSKGAANSISKISKISKKNVKIIYNPIDIDNIDNLSSEYIEFPWQDSFPIIISSGRLSTQKDFPCILEAFSIMKKQCPSHLVIIGEGEQRKILNNIIDSLEINNDVWLPGFFINPYSYMARANLYVLSSRFEGLPNVLIEALALGVPIVATNCPSGPEEILANGKYGRLVPVGDPISLAEAMRKSLTGDHPAFDRAEALQRFHPELITDQYLEALGFPDKKRFNTRY